jgi:hypothetical protein
MDSPLGVEKPRLTISVLQSEASAFAESESAHAEPSLYGTDNGKRVGTYLEHKFRDHLAVRYLVRAGSSAHGIDFPELRVDVKVTSVTQPQSSCPYESARQKVFGLGYAVLLFVYEKSDDDATRTANLRIVHCVFVEAHRTGDFQATRALRDIVAREGNEEDIVAYLRDRNLPVDEIEAAAIAQEVLRSPPAEGYLTISNALQWRLQYSHAIRSAGKVGGLLELRG